jgi:hypothetical protein
MESVDTNTVASEVGFMSHKLARSGAKTSAK